MEMAQLLLTTIKTLMNYFLSLPSPHLGIAIYFKDPYSRAVPVHPAKQIRVIFVKDALNERLCTFFMA